MHIEYKKWFSEHLNKEMEMKIYGTGGKPVIAFPCEGGRFYDWENFKMIESVEFFIEEDTIQLFTVDSLCSETWANKDKEIKERAERHKEYEKYLMGEVVPFVKEKNPSGDKIMLTGASMGGYHAANFFFKHPETFDMLVALSPLFHLKKYVDDYMDEYVYYNAPLVYMPNLNDETILQRFRENTIVIAVGQGAFEGEMLAETREMEKILREKQIPAWIDYWGNDVNHDWQWWRRMFPYFIETLRNKM